MTVCLCFEASSNWREPSSCFFMCCECVIPRVCPLTAQTHERLPLVAICPGNEFEECETKKVHVFGEQWSLQPDGYEPVVFRYPMLSYAASSIKSFFGG